MIIGTLKSLSRTWAIVRAFLGHLKKMAGKVFQRDTCLESQQHDSSHDRDVSSGTPLDEFPWFSMTDNAALQDLFNRTPGMFFPEPN